MCRSLSCRGSVSAAVLTLLLALAASARLLAADTAADVFRAKGLSKRGNFFCLPQEIELNKSVAGPRSESMKKKKAVDEAQAASAAAQAKTDDFEKKVQQWHQAYDQLKLQYAGLSPTSPQASRLAKQINQLIALLEAAPNQMEQAERALKDLRKTAAQKREEYIQYVLKLRQQYAELETRYRELAADPELKKALDQAGEAGTKIALGPTKSTTEALRKLEAAVITDAVPIHFGLDRMWRIFVSFNDQPPQEMGIDTGASLIVLPHKMAQSVGLTATSESPRIKLTLADGVTTIEASLLTASSVRVGRFSLKNVKCAVLPDNLEKAEPLLGMSFLGQFNFKIDKDQNKLVLAAVGGSREAKFGSASPSSAAAAAEASPAAQPAGEKPQTPAEQLAQLLTLPPDEPGRQQVLRTQGPGGKSLVFQPSKRGPAKTLQGRFGDPDEMRKIASPFRSDEESKDASWKLWVWGHVMVLVDDTGNTRYFAVVEE